MLQQEVLTPLDWNPMLLDRIYDAASYTQESLMQLDVRKHHVSNRVQSYTQDLTCV